MSLRAAAHAANGRLTKADLKAIESGTLPLDDDLVAFVGELYGCDLAAIMPLRRPIEVVNATLCCDGRAVPFTPHDASSLLGAYLQLVKSMRSLRRATTIVLRHDDIAVLARHLGIGNDEVVRRITVLMAGEGQPRAAVSGLFASGALVVGIVGTAVAGGGGITSRTALVRGPMHDTSDVARPADEPDEAATPIVFVTSHEATDD
jgi:hypothetical protein